MKKFLIKTSVYLSFVLLLFSYPIYILISSKENLYNIDNIYKRDKEQKYLVGYAYNEDNYSYLKYSHIINNPKYTVMALGSSRVLQFRAEMFEVPFYNAGYTIKTMGEFEQFLRLIPDEKLPKYLIIGLDQWMFNQNLETTFKNRPNSFWTKNNNKNYSLLYKNIKILIDDLWNEKIQYRSKHKDDGIHKIGLNAIINGKGFRNDGSILYGEHIKGLNKKDSTSTEHNFENLINEIKLTKSSTSIWKNGDFISAHEINKLLRLINYCKSKQIQLIAFTPPYANRVYQTMMETGKYNYILKIEENIKNLDLEWHIFNNAKACNSSDEEFIDGFHGGESTYLKMLIDMLKDNSILNNLCNQCQLKSELQEKVDNYIIYPY